VEAMKKKIHPKDQTRELSRAKLEFLKRNADEFKELKRLFEENEKKRDELIASLASISGELDPKLKESWDFLFDYSGTAFDGEFSEHLQRVRIPNAANAVWRWIDYSMELAHERMFTGQGATTYDDLKKAVLEKHTRDARGIFTELTDGRPAVHLLMGIDLTRSKDVIMAEVERLVTEHQTKMGKNERPKGRLRWLSIVDEILAVWDAANSYERVRDFRAVARKLNMEYSTVQKRWNLAYKLIYGREYSADEAKETMRDSAFDLCAHCPPEKAKHCYVEIDGRMEFRPCEEFKKLYGTDYLREKILENSDVVLDAMAHEQWSQDEEPVEYME
jgi:hypothetical protein